MAGDLRKMRPRSLYLALREGSAVNLDAWPCIDDSAHVSRIEPLGSSQAPRSFQKTNAEDHNRKTGLGILHVLPYK